jgi:hypothetical protein
MKKITSLLIIGAALLSNQAMSCDTEKVFNGKLKLELVYHKDGNYETAIIKRLDTGEKIGRAVVGRDRQWDVRNAEDDVIGIIRENLVIDNLEDDCSESITKLKKLTKNKYQITRDKISVGEIQGRLPKEY